MMEGLVLLLALAFAWVEAERDYWAIGSGAVIDKRERWAVRAVACFSVVALLDVAAGCSWWSMLSFGALFNARFRWLLNRMRGLEWWYLSPSSWHDYMYLRLFLRRYTREEMKEDWFILRFSEDAVKAGRLSYAADAAGIAAGLLLSFHGHWG